MTHVHVGFSTTNNILSRIVRFFTKSTVSHVFVVVELLGKPWVLDATAKGVALKPFGYFQKHNKIKCLIGTNHLTPEHVSDMMGLLGQAYDYSGLLGGIIPAIGKLFKKHWRNPFNNPKASFCSEFVTQGLINAGYPGAENLVPADTSPEDLMEFLLAQKAG